MHAHLRSTTAVGLAAVSLELAAGTLTDKSEVLN